MTKTTLILNRTNLKKGTGNCFLVEFLNVLFNLIWMKWTSQRIGLFYLFISDSSLPLYLTVWMEWMSKIQVFFVYFYFISVSSFPLYLTIWMEWMSQRFRVYVC